MIINALQIKIKNILNKNNSDIYNLKSRWKFYLGILGIIIIVISAIYTHYLVGELRKQEQARIDLYREAIEIVSSAPGFDEMPPPAQDFILRLSQPKNIGLPVILTDDRHTIQDAFLFTGLDSTGLEMPRDSTYIYTQLYDIMRNGSKPIYIQSDDKTVIQKVYYADSRNLRLLKYYPIFQFILIALFIAAGYFAFSSARRSEQNRVWVGMAKETAHQLGTPIAAILGWIEHLRMTHEDDANTMEVVDDLEHDVERLSLVADRFSKIGSEPELETTNLFEAIERCRIYMQKRASRKVVFDFPQVNGDNGVETPVIHVKLNNHLFDWVVENLLRNALDAMEKGEGTITTRVYQEGIWAIIDISDTGKGIPTNKFKTVFNPGFTTKKRGWGLGLSLAKRIIENYHGGKIHVKESVAGKKTTFTIKLPIVK